GEVVAAVDLRAGAESAAEGLVPVVDPRVDDSGGQSRAVDPVGLPGPRGAGAGVEWSRARLTRDDLGGGSRGERVSVGDGGGEGGGGWRGYGWATGWWKVERRLRASRDSGAGRQRPRPGRRLGRVQPMSRISRRPPDHWRRPPRDSVVNAPLPWRGPSGTSPA